MILTDLEGTIVEGKEGFETYKNYVESYTCVFELLSWKCLNTPVHKLYSLGSNKSMGADFTLIDSFQDFIARGRLYELTTQFRKYGSRFPSEEFLSEMLKSKGYDLKALVESLVERFIETYLDQVKYILNQKGVQAVVTKNYNIPVIKTEKIKVPAKLIKDFKTF